MVGEEGGGNFDIYCGTQYAGDDFTEDVDGAGRGVSCGG